VEETERILESLGQKRLLGLSLLSASFMAMGSQSCRGVQTAARDEEALG
jgi:hypothetical protein